MPAHQRRRPSSRSSSASSDEEADLFPSRSRSSSVDSSTNDSRRRRDGSGEVYTDSSGTSSSDEEEKSEGEGWEKRVRGRRSTATSSRPTLFVIALVVVLFLGGGASFYFFHSSSSSDSSTSSSSSSSASTSPSIVANSTASTTAESSSAKFVTSGTSSKTTAATATSTSSASGSTTTSSAVAATESSGWMPVDVVRGVNLGSLFVIEPWMLGTTWDEMGCSDYNDEWSCIEALGLETLQPLFQEHWSTFYNATDFEEMARLGLNTVRIPLGYWSVDTLIDDDEYFPKGQMPYLQQVCKWAKEAGIYVILDLHAAPGSQTVSQSFTGHSVDTAGFFSEYNYRRAYDCLSNWTIMAHTIDDFSTVRMIQVVNEPLQDTSTNLTSVFYPGAYAAIRAAEADLGISCDDGSCLAIQFMDTNWGSGDPTAHLNNPEHVVFDDHNYAQWMVDEAGESREGYMEWTCSNTRATDMTPVITGEWSISTTSGYDNLTTTSDGALEWFQEFAAANIVAAERGAGWIFWSYKTELNSMQWAYQDAVVAGYTPEDLSTLNRSVCHAYT